MRFNTLLLGTFATALLLSPALAAAGKMAAFFTPEQRAMYMLDARAQVQDMTPEQRHAFRHDQMAKVMAMSDSERTHLKTDLQAKWDALPQARKDRIEQRIAMRTKAGGMDDAPAR
jgi:hypothetical protein